jgi:hypothetical protein
MESAELGGAGNLVKRTPTNLRLKGVEARCFLQLHGFMTGCKCETSFVLIISVFLR